MQYLGYLMTAQFGGMQKMGKVNYCKKLSIDAAKKEGGI